MEKLTREEVLNIIEKNASEIYRTLFEESVGRKSYLYIDIESGDWSVGQYNVNLSENERRIGDIGTITPDMLDDFLEGAFSPEELDDMSEEEKIKQYLDNGYIDQEISNMVENFDHHISSIEDELRDA